MPDRTRARQLAAEHLAKGDPTGWFERLYQEAEEGKSSVPWAELRPNPNLLDSWTNQNIPITGKTALKIGCGLGDDAEQLAEWGFSTTAFDISPSAIRACLRRFPHSRVTYTVADLLHPPGHLLRDFDFVLESYTLQVLPPELRELAIQHATAFIKDGGFLLAIARGREENEPPGEMPWPLTRRELNHFTEIGLRELSFEDFYDREAPPVRRFRALYLRPGGNVVE